MDDSSLEFTAAYKHQYKEKFNTNTDNYFEELVKKSGIDPDLNRQTAKKYREVQAQADNLSANSKKQKGIRTLLVVLMIVCLAVAVICLFAAITSGNFVLIVGTVVGLAVFVALLVVVIKVLNPKIKNLDAELAKKQAEADKLKEECYAQLRPLFNLYDNFCTFALIQKTVPLFKFDRNFNMKRYDYFYNKYGISYSAQNNKSTLDIFSGEIQGNPFYLQKELEMTMGTQTYYGSLVITWTETVRDSNGYHTVTRTQTLTASVTKPMPYYATRTRLIYANDAAPDLSFSHTPQHWERLNEKQIKNKVDSGHKKIQKMAEKAVKSGGSFTELGNPEFDVLFNATDRDNEVQFRLMFTPLAQKNMLQLMKDPDPFGDDFSFVKKQRINYIASEHSQVFDYSVNTSAFISYDIDICKKQFLDYNNSFFKNLYFEFAPLMAIPLYQQYKPTEFIYQHEYSSNNSMYEAEVLANRLDSTRLQHPDTRTNVILNAHFSKKEGDSDIVTIDAHSFTTVEHIEYVPVLGGDRRMHNVPVPWTEYIPISNQTLINLSSIPTEQDDLRDESLGDSAKRHGLWAKLI